MIYKGRAAEAARKMILLTLFGLIFTFVVGFITSMIGHLLIIISLLLGALWFIFVLFTLYFFRDPDATVPSGPGLLVSPGHGKVDVIDQLTEPLFMGGPCQRVSIFLSVFNVHVQNSPVSGKLAFYRYTEGEFLNALKTESAAHNENALLGFEAAEEGTRVGVRLIAGLIARRIIPYISLGESVTRGQRISLIQFGSRVDLYFPLTAKINVKLGQKVVGGETIIATLQ